MCEPAIRTCTPDNRKRSVTVFDPS